MSDLRDKLPELKRQCGSMLAANGLRPSNKSGARVVHAFYRGAMAALGDETNPYVTLCLLSGRHGELCDFSHLSERSNHAQG